MEAESQEDVNGEWVKYEDYARLHSQFANSEQENARLKADIKDLREDRIRMCDVTIEDIAVIARLKAEVERLRKAGDAMYSWLGVCGRGGNSFGDDWLRAKKGAMLQAEQFDLNMKNRGWNGWNAAKESKPSA